MKPQVSLAALLFISAMAVAQYDFDVPPPAMWEGRPYFVNGYYGFSGFDEEDPEINYSFSWTDLGIGFAKGGENFHKTVSADFRAIFFFWNPELYNGNPSWNEVPGARNVWLTYEATEFALNGSYGVTASPPAGNNYINESNGRSSSSANGKWGKVAVNGTYPSATVITGVRSDGLMHSWSHMIHPLLGAEDPTQAIVIHQYPVYFPVKCVRWSGANGVFRGSFGPYSLVDLTIFSDFEQDPLDGSAHGGGSTGYYLNSVGLKVFAFDSKLEAAQPLIEIVKDFFGKFKFFRSGSREAIEFVTVYAGGQFTFPGDLLPEGEYTFEFTANDFATITGTTTIDEGGQFEGTLVLPTADADRSNEVDASDIDFVIANYGQTPSSTQWDGGYSHPLMTVPSNWADIDFSGEVDAADVDEVVEQYGLVGEIY